MIMTIITTKLVTTLTISFWPRAMEVLLGVPATIAFFLKRSPNTNTKQYAEL